MSVWVFVWLMVALKVPVAGLYLIVRWAIRQTPETAGGADGSGEGGVGPRHRSRHPRPPRPRLPRRGPHGEPALPAPPRIRTVIIRQPVFAGRLIGSAGR